MAEHQLLARVVHLRTENEAAALCGRLDRPAREGARDVDHVLLCVSTVDAQRVQLEQLAAVVLIQPLALSLLLLLLLPLSLLPGPHDSHDAAKSASAERPSPGELVLCIERRPTAVSHAARVVQIEEHRRALRNRFEQVAEFPERAWANDVLIEIDEVVWLGRALRRVDVEVVLPEIGHDFLELPLARYRPRRAR